MLDSNKGQAIFTEKILTFLILFSLTISLYYLYVYFLDSFRYSLIGLEANSLYFSIQYVVEYLNRSEVVEGIIILDFPAKFTVEGKEKLFIKIEDKFFAFENLYNISGSCSSCNYVAVVKKNGKINLVERFT